MNKGVIKKYKIIYKNIKVIIYLITNKYIFIYKKVNI